MKTTKTFKRIIVSLMMVTLMLSFMACTANGLVETTPYDVILIRWEYDHIEYNGTPYYRVKLSSEDPIAPHETVYVTIVDKKGKPYDVLRQEEAWVFEADPEKNYIYFNDAYYTKDKSLASVHYGFSDGQELREEKNETNTK